MTPTKPKPKHIRQAPDWIDEKTVKSLPPEKQYYWHRRLGGQNGQEDNRPKPTVFKTPDNITIGFDNEGRMVARTRAYRRKKVPTDNKYTKNTHAIQKARKK